MIALLLIVFTTLSLFVFYIFEMSAVAIIMMIILAVPLVVRRILVVIIAVIDSLIDYL